MSRRLKFWLGLSAFAVVYLALRVFWLSGDPGIPAIWEYGYNATDEGYYLCGGKEKLLWGCFVDLPRTEAFTYGFSAGTHGLSYLAHLLFGLSTWTWRIPFFALTGLAWLTTYVYLAKKSGALRAFLLCLAFSSVPMVIAYERTASNDVLIGALTVMAYVLATGATRWRLFASAVLVSLVVLVKPSVWIVLPIVAAGVLQTRKFCRPWMDVACFAAVAVLGIVLCRVAVALAVWPDAQRAGVTIWEVVRRTTTHYPLPSLWDFASHFRGLSAFPRVPSYALLGVTTAFAVILPAILFLRRVAGGRLNGNTLLFAAVPAYVAAINVMNTQYTHYFLPALMLLPIVTDAAVDELTADGADVTAPVWRKMLPALGLSVAACAVGLLFLASWQVSPQDAQPYYSRIYNFPAQNVWGLTWPVLMVFVAAVVAALLLLCGPRGLARNLPVWTVSAFVAASVVFAALPAVHLAPALRQDAGLAFAPLAVVLIVSVVLLIAAFGLRTEVPWRSAVAPFAFLSVVVCYLATPNWRQSAVELVKAPTHFHAQAAQELKAVLPADAIVIGERSNQMLMSLPIRTATTFAANSDPIPVIRSILKANPNAKLYALADSQHAYNLQHYREHANEYALRLIKTLKMPSFGTGALADVYLCKIEILPSGAN